MPTVVKLQSRVPPILVVSLLIIQLVDPYKGWVILLVGLGGALLLSYLWARSLAQNLTLKREMRFGWVQVGDLLEEQFTLYNNGLLPGLWVEIHDQSDIPGYQPGRVASVGSRSKTRFRTRGMCSQRGMFTLGPTQLKTSDPFGFFEVSIQDRASTTLMVMPPIVPLPYIDIAPGGRAGEGPPRMNAPERTVSVASVREYLPGDGLRQIHWPTSARKNDFFVRQFDSTPSSDWWLVLDLNKDVHFGDGQSSTEEHAVIMAASLADRGLRHGRSIGLVAHGSHPVWLPPQAGQETRWQIFQALALVETGDRPVHNLLERVRSSLSHNSSLVLITPDINGEWMAVLLSLFRRGIKPTVILLDPTSYGSQVDLPNIAANLTKWGISQYVITPDLLDRPEARPGEVGKWEWRISPSGRAIPVKTPGDMDWETLS